MPSVAIPWDVGTMIVPVKPGERVEQISIILLVQANVNLIAARKAVPTQFVVAARSQQVIRASAPVAIIPPIGIIAAVRTDELKLEIVPRKFAPCAHTSPAPSHVWMF